MTASQDSVTINVRMSKVQAERTGQRAKELGLSRSEWMRLVGAAALLEGEPDSVKKVAAMNSFTAASDGAS